MRKKYVKRDDQYIVAIQLNLDTDGFKYIKWGSTQQCKPGDWLAANGNNTYTIDKEVFEKTYEKIGDGKFIKTTPIWAELAMEDGYIETKEGKSFYKSGDYLISNNKDGSDAYCISADKFNKMYELN